MSKVYYRVIRTDFEPKLVQTKVWQRQPDAKSGHANFFETLEAAQKSALEWAAEYKRSYTVIRIEDMGSAAPSAPPVIWTPATNPLVGRYMKHKTDGNGVMYWKITNVRDNGDYDVVSPAGNTGLIYGADIDWLVV
jgi:hypothetical protein